MQFHDLGAQYRALKAEIDAGIAGVLEKGHFILGEQVSELEEALASDVGRRFCVTCGNGTDALVLALMLWGVGPGDAVFVPDFTYFASAGCATTVGAEMIPVDIRLDTFNIDPDALEAAIRRVEAEGRLRPAAVIPVDLFGLPAEFVMALGYAAVFGSGTNTLLASILIGCEVFGYGMLPYFFVTCIMAYLFNWNKSIFTSQQKSLVHYLRHIQRRSRI